MTTTSPLSTPFTILTRQRVLHSPMAPLSSLRSSDFFCDSSRMEKDLFWIKSKFGLSTSELWLATRLHFLFPFIFVETFWQTNLLFSHLFLLFCCPKAWKTCLKPFEDREDSLGEPLYPYYFPLSCVLVSMCRFKFARSCILKLVQKPARTRLVNRCPLTMLLSVSPPVDTRSLMIINRNCHQFTSFLTLPSVILFHVYTGIK